MGMYVCKLVFYDTCKVKVGSLISIDKNTIGISKIIIIISVQPLEFSWQYMYVNTSSTNSIKIVATVCSLQLVGI